MGFQESLVPDSMLISPWTAIPAGIYFLSSQYLPDRLLKYLSLPSPGFLAIPLLLIKKQ